MTCALRPNVEHVELLQLATTRKKFFELSLSVLDFCQVFIGRLYRRAHTYARRHTWLGINAKLLQYTSQNYILKDNRRKKLITIRTNSMKIAKEVAEKACNSRHDRILLQNLTPNK